MKNQLIHISCLLILFSFGCKCQSKKVEKVTEDTLSMKKEPVEKLYNPNLSIIEDNYTLKDSVSFYKVADYIISTAERHVSDPHEITDGSVSFQVYKMVYETSDEQVPLNRKLDLLSLLFFYHYHAANEYNAMISGKIIKADKAVISRPILLIPVLNATYWSEPILYTIISEETIILPKDYVSTMNKTLLEINELLNFRKKTEQHFNSPIYPLFNKDFRTRYPQHQK